MNIAQLLMAKSSWDIKSVRPCSTVRETAELLLSYKVGALVVTNAFNEMVGIVSERDLVQVVVSRDPQAADAPVGDLMTRSVVSCSPDDEVAFVLHLMNEHAIRHMPVVEQNELVGVLSIRELTKAYELLQVEANTDPLTQVSNRRPFLKTLEDELERARRCKHPLSVAMIDIDHFKRVNDRFGHDAGDEVLRVFAALLISEFRTIDLVGRLGGEEFAVLFPETDLAGAAAACERLLKTIRQTEVDVGESKISTTASIGLAIASEWRPDGASTLKRADELLYIAKNSGRDRLVADEPEAAGDVGNDSTKAAISQSRHSSIWN